MNDPKKSLLFQYAQKLGSENRKVRVFAKLCSIVEERSNGVLQVVSMNSSPPVLHNATLLTSDGEPLLLKMEWDGKVSEAGLNLFLVKETRANRGSAKLEFELASCRTWYLEELFSKAHKNALEQSAKYAERAQMIGMLAISMCEEMPDNLWGDEA